MALRAFYFIRTLKKALIYYYIKDSERHLLAIIENTWLESPKNSKVDEQRKIERRSKLIKRERKIE